jgi:hypothetical protein
MAQAEDVHNANLDSGAEARPTVSAKRAGDPSRRSFIGGSDARIIMGEDEAALLPCRRLARLDTDKIADPTDHLISRIDQEKGTAQYWPLERRSKAASPVSTSRCSIRSA